MNEAANLWSIPMRTLSLLPHVLLIAATAAAMSAPPSAAAQSIPDNIPDISGESPTDRAQAQLLERHRGFLSRIFTTGSFDAGPLPREGVAYQTNLSLGLDFRGGDAVFFALNSRVLPPREPLDFRDRRWLWYGGFGYTLSGTRFLGDTEAGQRSALTTELGVWPGETSLVALDVSPTYEILRGVDWSVPAGLRLSVARVHGLATGSVIQPFVGFTIGAKLHFFSRHRLELK